MTTADIYHLIFPTLDERNSANRAHFIRRFAENSSRLAVVVDSTFNLAGLGETAADYFHIQAIRDGSYQYCVLWAKGDWQESNERRCEIRAQTIGWQLEEIDRHAKTMRVDLVAAALNEILIGKTKDMVRTAAEKLIEDGDYANRAKHLEELFRGSMSKRLFYDLEELRPLCDVRGILKQQKTTTT